MRAKKANMAYWDSIDGLAENYVTQLIAHSMPSVLIDDEEYDDAVLELGKEITEFATKLLEEKLGANFPYVDEDY